VLVIYSFGYLGAVCLARNAPILSKSEVWALWLAILPEGEAG